MKKDIYQVTWEETKLAFVEAKNEEEAINIAMQDDTEEYPGEITYQNAQKLSSEDIKRFCPSFS
jgi:hypothetical protein